MKPTAVVTIGCPASGKSTFAKQLSSSHKQIERDLVRVQLAGSKKEFHTKFDRKVGEAAVSSIIRNELLQCAKNKQNVIISDTNINKQLRHRLYQDLFDMGFEVRVSWFDYSIEELVRRNSNRAQDDQVPEEVLAQMFTDFDKQRELIAQEARVLNFRIPEYKGQPKTIIFDIDGTIASHEGIRSPYDFDKVLMDNPRSNIIDLVNNYALTCNIVYFSGRDRSCHADTVKWISKFTFIEFDEIWMRPKEDKRPDWIVKGEMMIEAFSSDNNFYPWMVFDDRQQVVNIWDNMGIEVIQVQQSRF